MLVRVMPNYTRRQSYLYTIVLAVGIVWELYRVATVRGAAYGSFSYRFTGTVHF